MLGHLDCRAIWIAGLCMSPDLTHGRSNAGPFGLPANSPGVFFDITTITQYNTTTIAQQK
jgi:hypothetical protein